VTGEKGRVATPRSTTVVPGQGTGRFWTYYAAAATLALIATGAQLMRVTIDRREMRSRIAAADTLAPVTDSLKLALVQKDKLIQAMTAADVKIVQLAASTSPEPLGRVMWNRATDDWTIVAHNLRPPRAGMVYQVWLVTDGAPISAGTFRPDSTGSTMMQAKYALARNALRSVAITEEPEGGVPSPTGPVVVAGNG
jgi:anti-sigma-K factor RskA